MSNESARYVATLSTRYVLLRNTSLANPRFKKPPLGAPLAEGTPYFLKEFLKGTLYRVGSFTPFGHFWCKKPGF